MYYTILVTLTLLQPLSAWYQTGVGDLGRISLEAKLN